MNDRLGGENQELAVHIDSLIAKNHASEDEKTRKCIIQIKENDINDDPIACYSHCDICTYR